MVCIRGRQVVLTLALVATLLLGGGSVFAQEGPPEGRRGGRDFSNMSEEQREQMRQRMAERMEQRRAEQAERLQRELAVSDEEFAAIAPMIEKIRQLTRERGMALRPRNDDAGGPGGGRGFGFRGFEPEQAELSPPAKRLKEAAGKLRTSLEEQASEQQVQSNLASLRAAREQMEQAIADAREELRDVLLPRQEAVLVMVGVLE